MRTLTHTEMTDIVRMQPGWRCARPALWATLQHLTRKYDARCLLVSRLVEHQLRQILMRMRSRQNHVMSAYQSQSVLRALTMARLRVKTQAEPALTILQ